MNKFWILVIGICLGFGIWDLGFAGYSSRLKEVTIEKNKICISLTSTVEPKVFTLSDPYRIVVDLPDGFLIGENRKISVGSGEITSVRVAQNSINPYIARVVVDLTKEAEYKASNIGTNVILTIGKETAEGIEAKKAKEAGEERKSIQIPIEEVIISPKVASAEPMLSAPNQVAPEEKPKREYLKIIPSENIKIPVLAKYKNISAEFSGAKISIDKKPIFIDNALMVQASELFRILSCEAVFKTKEKKLAVSKEREIKAAFTIDSTKCTVNGQERVLAAPPTILNGKIYVPLISVIKYLGYGATWNSKTKTIYINPRIVEVKYSKEDGLDKILVAGSHPIRIASEEMREEPLRLVFTILNSFVDISQKQIKVGDGNISKIEVLQDKNLSKIVAYLDKIIFYHVKTIADENKINISFPPTIYEIRSSEEAGAVDIYIKATKQIKPVFKTLKEPDRIIVDIPNSMFKSTYLVGVEKGSVERIRSSQFKDEPLVSRVVIDLTQKGEYETVLLSDGKVLKVRVIRPEEIVRREKAKKYVVFKRKVIIIDPGHGGRDPGAFGYSGAAEKEFNLKTSLILNRMLLDAGAISQLTREDDTYVTLDDRINFAENHNADIFVSFHYNALERSNMSGTETYYFTDYSKSLADYVHNSLLSGAKRQDRGVRKVKFYTISRTSMPAILVEPAYITNKDEEELIKDPKFEEQVAAAILEGVKKYLEKK